METAIITGVTGQIGSHLADLLIEEGLFVVGLKRRASIISTERVDHLYDHPNFCLEYGNLNDLARLIDLIQQYRPKFIFNLGCMSHVRVSFDVTEETVDTIVKGTLNILNAIKLIDPTIHLYQASSSECYGTNPHRPYTEESKFMPASPYACAKVFAHHLACNYREAYNINASCGIVFNTEGERRGETFVTRKISTAAAKIKLGLQDKLFLGNLEARRDWTHAEDTVKAIWAMTAQDKAEDYVIASGENHSVRDFLRHTFKLADLDMEKHVEFDPRLLRPTEVPELLGSSAKAKKELGWEPTITFQQIVKRMYQADLERLQ